MNTYNELKEKASKGPVIVADRYADNGDYSHCDLLESSDGFCFAQVLSGNDAKLIAHTLNHFDKLLEALKVASEALSDVKWYNENLHIEELADKAESKVDKAIKEANEVVV